MIVDSNGQLVGSLVEGGLLSENIASAALEVDGHAGVLLYVTPATLNASSLYYASSDCSGQPHVLYQGAGHPVALPFGGSFFAVADQGDLYSVDAAETIYGFTVSSFRFR